MKSLIYLAALISSLSFAGDIDFAGRVRTIGEGLVVNNHANIPLQTGISIGASPKAQSQSSTGGKGCIKWFTDDAPIYPQPEAYLQGNVCLLSDPDPAMRRLKIEAIEQGTAYRDVTINEQGGNVAIGALHAEARLHVQTDSNPTGYIEAIRIEGQSLANNWERGIAFTGNGGLHIGTVTAYLSGMDREVRIYAGGYMVFRVRQDGAVIIGNASGGFMGAGTLNVGGQIYRNGVPLP